VLDVPKDGPAELGKIEVFSFSGVKLTGVVLWGDYGKPGLITC